MYWLTREQKAEIKRLALASPASETCGFVLDDGSVLEVPNSAEDPVNEFAIDPAIYAEHDQKISGIWHSHLELAGFSPLDQQVLATDDTPWAVYCMADDTWHECAPAMRTFAPLEGRPFVYGVYDCYSLVQDFLAKKRKVNLPDWERKDWGEWNTPSFTPFDVEWTNYGKRVTDGRYQRGDILLLNLGDHRGHTDHVGVFTDSRHFLHHPSGMVSRLQTFGGYWERRLNWVVRPFALWGN